MSKSKRDTPLASTVKQLLALSGNRCAFPGCDKAIFDNAGRYIAQLCHIEAASKLGQRYNEHQKKEERRGIANLMFMCYDHHIETNDTAIYDVPKLKEIKRFHEEKTSAAPSYTFNDTDIAKVLESLKALESLKDDLTDIKEQQFSILGELQEIKSNTESITQIKVDYQSIYLQQIETFKELKKIGKHESAIFGLENYKKTSWAIFSDETKYKILVNLGIFYLDLQKKIEAGNALFELRHLTYETKDKYALIALGAALLQNKEEFKKSYKIAYTLNKDNVNLHLAYIQMNFQENYEKIFKKIPKSAKRDPDILFSLGDMLTTQGRYEEGKVLLLKSVGKVSGDNLKVADLKGVVASKILSYVVTPYKYFFDDFSNDELKEIKEVSDMLTETWGILKDTEMAKSRFYIPMNLGAAYKVLKQPDDALYNFRVAYNLSNQYLAFKNLIVIYLETDKQEKAVELIEGFSLENLSVQEQMEIVLFKSQLEIMKGVSANAIPLYDAFIEQHPTHLQKMVTAGISSLLSKELFNEAKLFSDKYLSRLERNDKILVLLGATYVSLELMEDARAVILELQSKVNTESSEEIINDTANLLLNIGEVKGAISLFKLIIKPDIFNYPAKKLIISFFDIGEYFEAYKLCQKYKKVSKQLILDEVLLRIYINIHDYPKAMEIVYKLIEGDIDDKKQNILFQGLKMLAVQSKWKEVKSLLERVSNFGAFSINQVFPVAMFLMKSGNPDKAMDFVFRMRKRYYDIGDMHKIYLSFITLMEDYNPKFFDSPIIKNNSVVDLQKENGDINQFFLVSDRDIVDSGITAGEPFYDLLYGKTVGDKIEFSNGIITETFIVDKIDSLYFHESKKSLQLFQTRFTNQGFFVNDFSSSTGHSIHPEVIKEIVRHNNIVSGILDGYKNGTFTIGQTSNLLNESIVHTWGNFINSTDIGIRAFDHAEQVTVDNDSITVIDITVLLNCFLINPEHNILSALKGKKYVAQSTVDLLNFHCEEVQQGLLQSMNRNEGQNVIQFLELKVKGYKNAIEWCHNHAETKTFEMYKEINAEFLESGANAFGECFYHSLLLAKQLKCSILSDDLNLRNALSSFFGINSFSSISMLFKLFELKTISIDAFEGFLFNLLINNYIIIPPFGSILTKSLIASGYEIRRPFTTAVFNLKAIANPGLCKFVSLFARDVLISELSEVKKNSIMTYVFNHLKTHSQYNEVLNQIESILESSFKLLPNHIEQIKSLWRLSIQNEL